MTSTILADIAALLVMANRLIEKLPAIPERALFFADIQRSALGVELYTRALMRMEKAQ